MNTNRSNQVTIVLSVYFVLFFATQALYAQSKEIKIDKLPENVEDFVKMRNDIAKTPEGGAAVFIAALMNFSKSQDLGMQCLTVALDKSNVTRGKVYKGFRPGRGIMYHVDRITGYKRWSYLGFAYTKGATAEKNYKVEMPFIVASFRNKYSGDESKGRVKVFIEVDGFRARPIILKRNKKGYWKALGVSSMFLDLKKPANQIETDEL